jgi:hypothetical protein
VGQFIDALKTSIINGYAFRSGQISNYEDGGATLLDNLQSLIRASNASAPMPFTSNGIKIHRDASETFHVAEQVQEKVSTAVHAGDMEVFSVACDTGFFARQLLCCVKCDACKTCLTSQVISTSVFTCFKE